MAQLQERPLLGDGAMGTELYARGISYESCFEQLNLTNPELIKSIHLDYIGAGSQLIETNTFGANRYRLAEHGLEKSVRQINRAGAKIAREVRDLSEAPILLAGNIGPLGSPLAPVGKISSSDAFAAFLEQAEALLQSGVDLFLLETFSDLQEMNVALRVLRSVTELPIIALMTFDEDGTVASGENPAVVAHTLQDLGAQVVGVNCALGPASMFDVVEAMCQAVHEGCYVAAQPNAGLPQRVGSHFLYSATPDYFAAYARRFLDAGVRLLGGCCGTTAQHIAAMGKVLVEGALATQAAAATSPAVSRLEVVPERKKAPQSVQQETHFARLLRSDTFVVSIEMSPPRSLKYVRLLRNATYIRDCGADMINITDNAMARVRMNNVAAARLIQQHVGIETIAHFTPRDRNLMAVQSDIIGAHASDIRNILAITGDPPTQGDFPNATGIWDVDSIGLIAILRNLNQGFDARGHKLATPGSFFIGCAASPVATDLDVEMDRLRQKIEQGAQFIMTQPVFDAACMLDFLERYQQRYGPITIPVLMGLQPLHSYQQAEKFHQEVPGIVIPDHIRLRLRDAGSASGAVGLEIAREIFDALSTHVQGVYIMPLDRFEIVGELLPYVRERTRSTLTEANKR